MSHVAYYETAGKLRAVLVPDPPVRHPHVMDGHPDPYKQTCLACGKTPIAAAALPVCWVEYDTSGGCNLGA